MRTFVRLLGYVRPYGRQVAIGMGCMLLGQPLQLLHPLFWKFVVDDVLLSDRPPLIDHVGGSRVALLGGVLGAMFLAHSLGAVVSALRQYVLGVVAQRVGRDLRGSLYEHMQRHSLRFFHDRRSGDLVSRATGDVETVQRLAANGVDELIGNAVQLVLVWGVIFFLSWQVALALVVPMASVGVLIYRFNRRIRPIYRAARDRLGDVSAKVQENLLGMLVIKAFTRERQEQAKVDAENARYYAKSVEGLAAHARFGPTMQVVGFTSNLIMLGVGAIFVMRGQFTVGGLVALRGYWWYLFAPVWSLARVNDMVQRSLAAADRVFEVMDEPVEIADAPDAADLAQADGRIAFESVTFSYGPAQPPVLRDIRFELAPGETLGVAGPSGAGKSTLLGLLLRFYDPQAGTIRLDGHALGRVRQASLRRQMAIVTQEPFLFNTTVGENIRFGRLEATDRELIDAARLANAHEFIEQMPDGYDTVVGERGVKLSGGQKQRICIARAFLANPRILLLDEATASVEPESEAIIQAALDRLMRGRTSVVVSHRLSMIRGADQIIVIAGGRIAERGRHDGLMARDGWYARMYRLQVGEETL